MTGIYSIPQSFREGLTNLFKEKYQLISEWKGHIVQVWDVFLQDMKNRPRVAITVFTVANLIFFTLINNLAWSLESRTNNVPQKLSEGDRKLNYILIDGVVVGGSVLTFNLILSQLTQYSLSKTTLAAITIGSIALRSFFHIPVEEALPLDENEEVLGKDGEKTDESKSPLPKSDVEHKEKQDGIDNKPLDQKDDKSAQKLEEKQIEKAKIAKALKMEAQATFINEFCSEMDHVLKKSFHYVNFDENQRNAQLAFLEQMKLGVATIEDQPDLCRAVNVPIQAAFEKLLCTMLASGHVQKAKVVFLTGLPCTPLRTPLQDIDTEKAAEWKKWTVDIRTQTVRALRETGATIAVCYSADDYQALPDQSAKGKTEFETYEVEKKIDNTFDCPLLASIPKDLIGAVYFITDEDDNEYILATQGIQIQNHGSAPKECWKMWFGTADHPDVKARANEMMNFVHKYTNITQEI